MQHPPTHKQRLKRTLQELKAAEQEQEEGAAELPGGQPTAQEGDEESGLVPGHPALLHGPKQLKLTTSKIAGVAHPRRPRIGADFQAAVPEWTGPPPS